MPRAELAIAIPQTFPETPRVDETGSPRAHCLRSNCSQDRSVSENEHTIRPAASSAGFAGAAPFLGARFGGGRSSE